MQSISEYLRVYVRGLDLTDKWRLSQRWVQRWIIESSAVWGNIQSIAEMGCAQSCEMERFCWRDWNLEVFPNNSVLPTLHIFLHIDNKLHSPQTVLSRPLSIQIPKHRWKRAPSYFVFESVSCYCCMYHHCCSTIVLFSIVPCSI